MDEEQPVVYEHLHALQQKQIKRNLLDDPVVYKQLQDLWNHLELDGENKLHKENYIAFNLRLQQASQSLTMRHFHPIHNFCAFRCTRRPSRPRKARPCMTTNHVAP